jgi:hypothetical protein
MSSRSSTLAQRLAGRGDDAGVEGVAHGEAHGTRKPFFSKTAITACRPRRWPRRTHIGAAVDVGRDDVAVTLLSDCLHLFVRRQNGRHLALVVHADLGHLRAARGRGFQRMGKGHDPGGNQRRVFAQRVAHHHVGLKAVALQQLVDGDVHRQHGGLGDFRLHQVKGGLVDGVGVVGVYKDVAGERLAQDRRHHRVGVRQTLL